MRVAAIQMMSGRDREENLRRAEALLAEAGRRGARLAALPEFVTYRGPRPGREIAETTAGTTVQRLARIAREHAMFIIAGSFYEKILGDTKMYNTSVVLSPAGRVVAVYRKRHLFQARVEGKTIRENRLFRPGRRYATATVGGLVIGSCLCYDLRFPRTIEHYAGLGCHAIVAPSAFTYETGKAHWEILVRGRAIDLKGYVIAPNQCGRDAGGGRAYGHSMIVGPWGEILAEMDDRTEGVVYAEVRREEAERVRRIFFEGKGAAA